MVQTPASPEMVDQLSVVVVAMIVIILVVAVTVKTIYQWYSKRVERERRHEDPLNVCPICGSSTCFRLEDTKPWA